MKRFPRSLADAFASERYAAMYGPYNRPTTALREVCKAMALLALFALIGVIAAWRM